MSRHILPELNFSHFKIGLLYIRLDFQRLSLFNFPDWESGQKGLCLTNKWKHLYFWTGSVRWSYGCIDVKRHSEGSSHTCFLYYHMGCLFWLVCEHSLMPWLVKSCVMSKFISCKPLQMTWLRAGSAMFLLFLLKFSPHMYGIVFQISVDLLSIFLNVFFFALMICW